MAYLRLPNGAAYPILEGKTPQDAWNDALETYPEAFGFAPKKPKQDTSGLVAAMKGTVEEFKGQGSLLAAKLGLKSNEEAMRDYEAAKARSREVFTPTQDDWSTSPWLKFKETLGGSLPYVAAPLAVGAAPFVLGATGPAALGIGALASTTVGAAQFLPQNVGRQYEEKGSLEQVDLGTASAAAIAQGTLETAGNLLLPGFGRLLGMAKRPVTEASARALADQTIRKIAWDYTKATGKAMPVQAAVEAAQQAIERGQAGLSIEDPEARKEFIESAQGGAALTLLFGPLGRAFERGGIKAEGRRLEQARLGEERAAAEAESAKAAEAEATRKAQPEYLDKLIADFEAAKQGVIDNPKPKKPKKDASPEEELAYEDALAKHKTALETFKPLKDEYKSRLTDITARRQQRAEEEARAKQQQAEEEARAKQQQAEEEARQGGQGPFAQMSIPGVAMDQTESEAPRTAITTGTVVPRETIQEQSLRERQNALDTAMSDFSSAQAAGDTNAVQEAAARIQQLRSQITEAAPAPAVSPVEQEKQSIFQRLQLQQQIEDLSVRAKQAKDAAMAPGVTPQATADAFKQVQSINQSIVGLKGEINRLGGRVSTLDELKTKRDSLLTKFENAKKAKAEPQVAKLLADIQKVDEKIALYEKPVDERQAGLDLRPAEPAPAPVATPKAPVDLIMEPEPVPEPPVLPKEQLVKQRTLSGFKAAETAAPTTEVTEPTAFELQDDIRKLEGLKKTQEDQLFGATTTDAYTDATRKIQKTEKLIADAKTKLDAITAQDTLQRTTAEKSRGEIVNAETKLATLKDRLAAAKERFSAALKAKDRSEANSAVNEIKSLGLQIPAAEKDVSQRRAAIPKEEPAVQQTDLEQGAAALQAYEKVLADAMAGGREQAVKQRKKTDVALEKARSDLQKLIDRMRTPSAAKEKRVARQEELIRERREKEQERLERRFAAAEEARFEAESPSAGVSTQERAQNLLDRIAAEQAARKEAETKARESREATSEKERAAREATSEKERAARDAASEKERAARETASAEQRASREKESAAVSKTEKQLADAKTKANEVAKAETDAKTAMDENPNRFEDKNFESDTDTDADVQLRANNVFFEERPTTPLSKAAANAAENNNVMGLLDELAKSKNPLHRSLSEAIKTLQTSLTRQTKISVKDNLVVDGQPTEGNFNASRNRIIMDRGSLNEESVLHELVHSVTHAALTVPIDALPLFQREARLRLEATFSKIQNSPAFAREYGRLDLKEFVAEVLTNSNLRNKLDSFDKTLWQRIVRGLMELIGLNPERLSSKSMEEAFALFGPPQKAGSVTNDAVVMASVMRGVFPGRGVVASDRVNESVVNTVNSIVGRTQSIGDRIMANATGLRLRTKLADNWAPTEALLKRGVEKGKVSEAQALQLRFLMRVTNDVNRQVSLAFTQGVPQLVTREGVKVLEGQTGVTPQQIAKVLGRSKLGNEAFVENLFTNWLAILRAEKEGIGYDRLNYGNDKDGNPRLDATKAAEIKAAVDSDPDTKAAFNEARDLYRQYNKDLLNLYVEAGAMSREKANELLKGDFIPYYRVQNGAVELMLGSRKVTIGNVVDQPQLKELVGSDEKILPLYSSMMQNTSLLLRGAVTNMQTRDVANMVQDMGLGKIIKGEGPRNVYVARFKNKGVDYYLRLDPSAFPDDIPADVFVMGLQGIKTSIPTAVRALQMPVGLLRKGITRMPVYAFRQLIRDPIHAYLTTGGDFSAVLDTYREFIKSLKAPTQAGEALERAGAVSSMVQTGDIEDQARILRSITSGKYSLARGMAMLDTFAHKADTATRAAVYNNYRKKGFSHLESVLAAAESMNFARRGTSASLHWMGAMIPFFNAQIQGLDAVYRAAFTKDVPFQERMKITQKLYTRGVMIAGMAMAYAMLMQDDEAYKNATPQERAMNWFIYPPGSDEPIRFPIPFELGFVFKALPELAINTAFGDTKARDALGVIRKQLEASVPIGIPSAVKPLVELSANHNFFTDAPIESAREVNLRPQDRFRANTTELAKLLGATTGASPLQIEHLVRGYTGTLGMALMSASNLALRPLTLPEDVSAPERKLSEMPFIGALFQPETGRGALDAVYKDIKEYEQAAQSYKDMVKAGRVAEAAEFASKYSAQIALNSTGGSFRQKMGELAELKRVIAAAPKMSGEEKQRQIDAIKRLEIQLARNIRDIAKNLE